MRSILPVLLLAACATTTPTTRSSSKEGGPRGLRASEHLDAARDHDEAARQRASWPERVEMKPGSLEAPYTLPWVRSWDTSADQERYASIHRSQAAAIQAEYSDACGNRPTGEVSVSPLQRYATGGWNTSTGVIVYLTPLGGPPERLLTALRCHRAWMMLAPSNMDDCPLDLPGLQLDARGDAEGITLMLSVRDPKLVPELQRRVAHDLEPTAHHMER